MSLRVRAAAALFAVLTALIMLAAHVFVVAALAVLFAAMAIVSIPIEKHRRSKVTYNHVPMHEAAHLTGVGVSHAANVGALHAAGKVRVPGDLPRLSSIVVVACVVLVATLPMGLNSTWTGEGSHSHQRNEYELMANSLIEGHLYLDYTPNKALDEMENPYDTQMRRALGVHVHWDSAYYNGKYYMYFGVVPAVLVFVPYKLITGYSLASYHATQLFTALYLIGLFFLMRLISRSFFPGNSRARVLSAIRRVGPDKHLVFFRGAGSVLHGHFCRGVLSNLGAVLLCPRRLGNLVRMAADRACCTGCALRCAYRWLPSDGGHCEPDGGAVAD